MKSIADDIFFQKSMKFCAWCGFLAIIFFIIGGVVLGGMLPPLLRANDPPDENSGETNRKTAGAAQSVTRPASAEPARTNAVSEALADLDAEGARLAETLPYI